MTTTQKSILSILLDRASAFERTLLGVKNMIQDKLPTAGRNKPWRKKKTDDRARKEKNGFVCQLVAFIKKKRER